MKINIYRSIQLILIFHILRHLLLSIMSSFEKETLNLGQMSFLVLLVLWSSQVSPLSFK